MTRIIFVRHGETFYNVEKKYQGQTDIALTPAGEAQGDAVAKRLAKEEFSLIYTSPLIRAKKTAEKISQASGKELKILANFREMNFGSLEGIPFAEVAQRWPELHEGIYHKASETTIPEGESFQEFRERIREAVAWVVANHPDETIVVVAHGCAIKAALCLAYGWSIDELWEIEQGNTALNWVEYDGENCRVITVNDTKHLA